MKTGSSADAEREKQRTTWRDSITASLLCQFCFNLLAILTICVCGAVDCRWIYCIYILRSLPSSPFTVIRIKFAIAMQITFSLTKLTWTGANALSMAWMLHTIVGRAACSITCIRHIEMAWCELWHRMRCVSGEWLNGKDIKCANIQATQFARILRRCVRVCVLVRAFPFIQRRVMANIKRKEKMNARATRSTFLSIVIRMYIRHVCIDWFVQSSIVQVSHCKKVNALNGKRPPFRFLCPSSVATGYSMANAIFYLHEQWTVPIGMTHRFRPSSRVKCVSAHHDRMYTMLIWAQLERWKCYVTHIRPDHSRNTNVKCSHGYVGEKFVYFSFLFRLSNGSRYNTLSTHRTMSQTISLRLTSNLYSIFARFVRKTWMSSCTAHVQSRKLINITSWKLWGGQAGRGYYMWIWIHLTYGCQMRTTRTIMTMVKSSFWAKRNGAAFSRMNILLFDIWDLTTTQHGWKQWHRSQHIMSLRVVSQCAYIASFLFSQVFELKLAFLVRCQCFQGSLKR